MRITDSSKRHLFILREFLKKVFVLLIYSISCILTGMTLYKYNLWPRPQIHYLKQLISPTSVRYPIINPNINNEIILVFYKGGINLYTDRDYYDSIADPRLESSYLIQIPRHLKSPI